MAEAFGWGTSQQCDLPDLICYHVHERAGDYVMVSIVYDLQKSLNDTLTVDSHFQTLLILPA